jgi:hypothetical protein
MDDKQISPEEKLLKVIQGGGGKSENLTPEEKMLNAVKAPSGKPEAVTPSSASGPASGEKHAISTEPAKPIPPKVGMSKPAQSAVKEQLKLKQAPVIPVDSGQKTVDSKSSKVGADLDKRKENAAPGVPAESVKSGVSQKIAETEPASAPITPSEIRKNPQSSSFFQIINWALGVVVLLVICLSGYEIYAGITTFGSIKNTMQVSGSNGAPAGGLQDLSNPYDLNAILKSFTDRPWNPIDMDPLLPSTNGIPTEPRTPWQTYAKENLKLMGFAGADPKTAEAILSDKKENKLLFLSVGRKIDIMGTKINVAEVQKDYVLLSDGKGSSLQIK